MILLRSLALAWMLALTQGMRGEFNRASYDVNTRQSKTKVAKSDDGDWRPCLKIISLATSVWTNSSRYFHPIPMISRLCRPRSSNLEHPSVLKSRLLRSHVNPLHVILLPLQPASPHAPKPPRPRPFSPAVPVPPPLPSNSPTSHSITATIPSVPDIPDPSPRSRTPRRGTDPLFAELIPVRNAPWVPQTGVEPVGAPGTTPLRPPAPGTATDPATDPFLSREIKGFKSSFFLGRSCLGQVPGGAPFSRRSELGNCMYKSDAN